MSRPRVDRPQWSLLRLIEVRRPSAIRSWRSAITKALRSDDVDPVALTEFLQMGNVYFGDTLVPGVRKIAANEW